MPDKTLEAFYDHGEAGDPMPPDGVDSYPNGGIDLPARSDPGIC